MKINTFFKIVTALILSLTIVQAYSIANYTSDTNYIVPAGGTYVYVQAWGGGGAGYYSCNTDNTAKGGGGGGAYSADIISVTPGQNYTLNIGEGGTAPSNTCTGPAVNGNDTEFNLSTTGYIIAKGGSTASGMTGGSGGLASAGTGSIKYSGGTGGNGGSPYSSYGSGAGGGGAGSYQNGYGGTNGSGTPNAPGGAGGNLYGGTGANGGTLSDFTGTAGNTLGGGGSGSSCDGGCGNARNGGAGARGQITITQFYANSTVIKIYDESSLILLANTTFSVSLTSSNGSVFSGNSSNGVYGQENLTPDTYTVQITGGSYQARMYTVTVEANTTTLLNAYMSTSSTQTTFILRASSGPDAGQTIQDGIVTAEKMISGNFVEVESRYSDITGTAGPITYTNPGYYRITITADNYYTKQFYLNPILYDSYDVYLISSQGYNYTQDYSGITLLYTPTTYTEETQNNFTFLASSPNGTFQSYNYTITYPGGNANNSGSNAYGESFTSNFNITGSTLGDQVTITYCYDTTETEPRCFTNYYEVQGIYGNYTLSNAVCSEDLGDFEKITIATIVSMIASGLGSLLGGPLVGGIVWLIVNGLMYKVLCFSIWLLLIPGFAGVFIIAVQVARR